MAWPKVSILWLNYNSSKILGLALKSLEALSNLDYPNDRYELIVVDNGSTDGSFEKIEEFLERKTNLKKKIIKLDRNLGFTGGNNIAYRARDRESRYVALLNNDAIPMKSSLQILVEYAEQNNDVGAVQGIILDVSNKMVDTAGVILNELFTGGQLYQGEVHQKVRGPFYITYADGAYFLLKIDVARKATSFSDKLFYDEMFGYFDDILLGLQVWDAGYRIVSYPAVSAFHRRSSTFGKITPLKLYLTTRGYYALNELCNSRYRTFIRKSIYLRLIRGTVVYTIVRNLLSRYRTPSLLGETVYAIVKGYTHGIRWGRARLKERGRAIDIYRAPLLPLTLSELQTIITGIGLDYCRKKFTKLITRKFEHHISNYLVE